MKRNEFAALIAFFLAIVQTIFEFPEIIQYVKTPTNMISIVLLFVFRVVITGILIRIILYVFDFLKKKKKK